MKTHLSVDGLSTVACGLDQDRNDLDVSSEEKDITCLSCKDTYCYSFKFNR